MTIEWIYATNKTMENISFHALHFKFNALPEKLKSEVLDFIDFLLVKERKIKGDKKQKMPKFGSCKGMFEMSPDFDEPLEDFKDYMY